ncbi:TldD/PmbA family protein [Picosynechococcus sp. NKBG042902]|uniref:TldD/PmbA family protein n=1 Tax=Picosynechococcus sp. NKBG042902 TaxID=490193 RepID=UPI0004AA1335|nr:TldD/PmbA family protein [Picosynechococcus sp. NKBG042902]
MVVEQILDLAKQKGIEAEVYYRSSRDTPIDFENNRLKSLETKASQGVALRVVVDGKLGFASATDLTRLEDVVDAAIATAEIGDPVDFEFAKDFQGVVPESDYVLPETAKLVKIGETLIEKVRAYNDDILVSAGFHIRSGQTKLATTSGVYGERNSKIVSASLGGNLVQGEDFLNAYGYDVAKDGEPDYDKILATLIEKYTNAEKAAQISSGQYPVLFTPRAALSAIGGLFDTILSGQVVVQKASPLAGKIGEQLFGDRLSIYEDPTIGVSACPFDDEGTPTQKKTFIQNGIVQQFYWDRQWAARGNAEAQGNGFRGGLSRPSPDMVNFCMGAGKTPLTELIKGMKEGVIVDQVLGAGQSNQLAGEFSVNLDLGYKVENGEIVGRLKNTMVAGSIFEAFADLVDFSDTCEWVGGSAYMPAILFGKLGVASRAV